MAGRGQFNPEDMPGFGQAGDLSQFDPKNMPGFSADGAMPQFDPENIPDLGQRGAAPGARARPEGVQPEAPARGMFERGGGGMGDNTQIPLLIKFDEFISGQTYQGFSRLAIRSSGISYDASMLREPITNYVIRLAGLPATQTAYAGIQINEEAKLNATMSYQGEDPSAYASSFTQETCKNEADTAPLIAFLRFLDESDDATFASQLPDYLDVKSFAAYLAVAGVLDFIVQRSAYLSSTPLLGEQTSLPQ